MVIHKQIRCSCVREMLNLWLSLLALVCLATLCSGGEQGNDKSVESLGGVLTSATVTSRPFTGSISVFGANEGADASPKEPDFNADELKEKYRLRVWRSGEDVLAEYQGDPQMAIVGPGSSQNDIINVLASSATAAFDFLPVGSSDTPFANLSVYNRANGKFVEDRLADNTAANLDAIVKLAGYDIANLLVLPQTQITANPAAGEYSADTELVNGDYSVNFSWRAQLTDAAANFQIKSVSKKGGEERIVVERWVEGSAGKDGIVPERILTRFSGKDYGVPYREVALISQSDLPGVAFPITKEFFKKYERDYVVLDGDSKQSSEFTRATPDRYSFPLDDRMRMNHSLTADQQPSSYWDALLVLNVAVMLVLAILYVRKKLRAPK